MRERWKAWAQSLRRNLGTLSLAARHPDTPWHAKLLAVAVVAYALSPIDLIPDPIPILGYLDDLVLLPAGIWLTLRIIPREVWVECQARVDADAPRLRPGRLAAVVIVALWMAAFYVGVGLVRPLLPR